MRLEAVIAPCNYIHDYVQDNGDTIDPSCIFDPEEQFAYVKNINVMVLHNSEKLNPEGFGPESIVQESKIIKMQVNPREPNWIELYIHQNSLEDETSVL